MIWNEDKQETVGIERTNKNGILTITYVQVVLCKDCRFRILHQCNCEKKENVTYGMFTEDDFFCANGEQKEG